MQQQAEGPGHWLAAVWEESLRRTLESMAGSAPALQRVAAEAASAAGAGWSWCRIALESEPAAALWAGCAPATLKPLARLIAGVDLEEADCRSTFLEVASQTAAAAAGAISQRLGKRVYFSGAQEQAPPPEWAFAVQLELSHEQTTHQLALAAGVELMKALDPAPAAAAPAPSPVATTTPSTPANLDLLLEVELPVCVTFGRTQLLLKDVLKLSSGSIVELNRLASEPVEVLINDCVIARGEVVVVDGNYGVRVTEIMSRQERIRTIL